MKTTIEFDDEEQDYAALAVQLPNLSSDLFSFYHMLRSLDRHMEYETEEARGLIDHIYTEYTDLFGGYMDI